MRTTGNNRQRRSDGPSDRSRALTLLCATGPAEASEPPAPADITTEVRELARAVHSVQTHVGLITHHLSLRSVEESASVMVGNAYVARPVEPKHLPVWLDARGVVEQVGLSEDRAREFAEKGYVRTAKLAESRSAARLYYVADLLEALMRVASGYMPRVKRGTALKDN